jgi:hypothetical protein
MFHEGWNSLKLWENVKATCENKSNKFSINVTVQYTINQYHFVFQQAILSASDLYEGCPNQ